MRWRLGVRQNLGLPKDTDLTKGKLSDNLPVRSYEYRNADEANAAVGAAFSRFKEQGYKVEGTNKLIISKGGKSLILHGVEAEGGVRILLEGSDPAFNQAVGDLLPHVKKEETLHRRAFLRQSTASVLAAITFPNISGHGSGEPHDERKERTHTDLRYDDGKWRLKLKNHRDNPVQDVAVDPDKVVITYLDQNVKTLALRHLANETKHVDIELEVLPASVSPLRVRLINEVADGRNLTFTVAADTHSNTNIDVDISQLKENKNLIRQNSGRTAPDGTLVSTRLRVDATKDHVQAVVGAKRAAESKIPQQSIELDAHVALENPSGGWFEVLNTTPHISPRGKYENRLFASEAANKSQIVQSR